MILGACDYLSQIWGLSIQRLPDFFYISSVRSYGDFGQQLFCKTTRSNADNGANFRLCLGLAQVLSQKWQPVAQSRAVWREVW